MKDRFAQPRREAIVATNISELLIDTSKINMMRILNCDEKYKIGSASDYEMLTEWERILPLCQGSGAAAFYRRECEWLEIADLPLCEKWRQGNSRLTETDFSAFSLPEDQVSLSRFVTNFVKKEQGEVSCLSDLVSDLKRKLESMEFQEIHLISRLPDCPFSPPNPYGADQAFQRMIRDGKYKDEDLCLVMAQLVISLYLDPPRNKKIPLHLSGEGCDDAALDLLSYLDSRRLFSGELYFGISPDRGARIYERLCAYLSDRITLRPELILTVPDLAEGLSDRLDALFRVYPRGAVSFGGVLTDSPLYFVAHKMLEDAGDAIGCVFVEPS